MMSAAKWWREKCGVFQNSIFKYDPLESLCKNGYKTLTNWAIRDQILCQCQLDNLLPKDLPKGVVSDISGGICARIREAAQTKKGGQEHISCQCGRIISSQKRCRVDGMWDKIGGQRQKTVKVRLHCQGGGGGLCEGKLAETICCLCVCLYICSCFQSITCILCTLCRR